MFLKQFSHKKCGKIKKQTCTIIKINWIDQIPQEGIESLKKLTHADKYLYYSSLICIERKTVTFENSFCVHCLYIWMFLCHSRLIVIIIKAPCRLKVWIDIQNRVSEKKSKSSSLTLFKTSKMSKDKRNMRLMQEILSIQINIILCSLLETFFTTIKNLPLLFSKITTSMNQSSTKLWLSLCMNLKKTMWSSPKVEATKSKKSINVVLMMAMTRFQILVLEGLNAIFLVDSSNCAAQSLEHHKSDLNSKWEFSNVETVENLASL